MTSTNMETIKRERRAVTGYIRPAEFDRFKETRDRVRIPAYEALRQAVAVWVDVVQEAEAAALDRMVDRALKARELRR
jgi:hypothetical protein